MIFDGYCVGEGEMVLFWGGLFWKVVGVDFDVDLVLGIVYMVCLIFDECFIRLMIVW